MLISPEHGNCSPQNSKLWRNLTRDEIERVFLDAFVGAAGRKSDLIIYSWVMVITFPRETILTWLPQTRSVSAI